MFSDVKILISFEYLDLPANTIGAFSMVSPRVKQYIVKFNICVSIP